MEHTLKDVQTKLAEEQQRLAHLREAFQVQYCADELDAAGLLATAHLAQSRAAHSAWRRERPADAGGRGRRSGNGACG